MPFVSSVWNVKGVSAGILAEKKEEKGEERRIKTGRMEK